MAVSGTPIGVPSPNSRACSSCGVSPESPTSSDHFGASASLPSVDIETAVMHGLGNSHTTESFRSLAGIHVPALMGLVCATIMLMVICVLSSSMYPQAFALSVVAYLRGLRLGSDISYVAAVGMVTSLQLYHSKGWPSLVGLCFSLGYIAVVVVLTGEAFATRGSLAAEHRSIIAAGQGAIACVIMVALCVFGSLSTGVALEQVGQHKASQQHWLWSYARHLARYSRDIMYLIDTSWKVLCGGAIFGLRAAVAAEMAPSSEELSLLGTVIGKEPPPVPFTLLPPLAFAMGSMLLAMINSVIVVGAYTWASWYSVQKFELQAFLLVIPAIAAIFGALRDFAALLLAPSVEDGVLPLILRPGETPGWSLGCTMVASIALAWLVLLVLWTLRGRCSRIWSRFQPIPQSPSRSNSVSESHASSERY